MMEARLSTTDVLEAEPSGYERLCDALDTERHLLADLSAVLTRQREGISTDDLSKVDESVHAAQRVLLTLQEARRRRRTLVGLLGGQEDVPLSELESTLGPTVTAAVCDARDELIEAARRLTSELEVNRRVIDGALAVGDELLSSMLGGPTSPRLYSRDAPPDKSGRTPGDLLNTTV